MKVVFPKKIVKSSKNSVNAKTLLKVMPLQIGLSGDACYEAEANGYIILDFKKEYVGSVRILTSDSKGSKKVRIRLGESLSETSVEIGEKNATNDHANRDWCVELQPYSDMTFNNSGFRYVRIDNLSGETLKIKAVVIMSTVYSKKAVGKFSTDDKTVNEIFSVAEHTLRCCIQNGYVWDGAKRDRLVWIGDLYPELKAINCLFGNIKEIENSIEYSKNENLTWINTMPAYSLWWIVNVCETYKNTLNVDFLKKQIGYVKHVVSLVNENVDDEGKTHYVSNFVDWQTHYVGDGDTDKRDDELAGMNALTVLALKNAKFLLNVLGEDTSLADEILNRLYKQKFTVKKYIQVCGLRYLAGLFTEKDLELMVKTGTSGMSTFTSLVILNALSNNGKNAEAFSMMKEYYGAMLDKGATSFFEDFSTSWVKGSNKITAFPKKGELDIHGDFGAFCYKGFRHSLCHGWSSGVISYLFSSVAGINVKEGYKEIEIDPNLATLNFINADYPTPYGKLSVRITKENGKVSVSVLACPKEIKLTVKQ